MTERKRTKGPWVYDGDLCQVYGGVVSSGGRDVAGGFGFPDEARANAHLIAAAPDLYEALEPLEEEAEFLSKGEEVEDYMLPVTLSVKQYRAIVAALSKARGEVK